MKKQWITIILFEILVLAGKVAWNTEYMESVVAPRGFFHSNGLSLMIGTELILGFCLWSVGMDFYKKLREMTELRNFLIVYPLVFAAVVSGIETVGNYLFIRNRVAYSPIRLLRFVFGTKTYDRENFIAYFIIELLIYYCFVLLGYVWQSMMDRFETSTLIAAHAVLVIAMAFVFNLFTTEDINYQTQLDLRVGYMKAKISAKDGDISRYFNFVSKEEMDRMLSNIQDGDTYFSFPLGYVSENESEPSVGYSFEYEEVPGQNGYSVTKFYDLYPQYGRRIRLGNGMEGNINEQELLESVEGCKIYHPESENLYSAIYSEKISYCIFADSVGRIVCYEYDSQKDDNMIKKKISINAEPNQVYETIYYKIF